LNHQTIVNRHMINKKPRTRKSKNNQSVTVVNTMPKP